MGIEALPKKMKAIQVVEYNKPYQINEVDVPHPGPGDVIVKIAVASNCHTDAMVQSGVFGTKLPVTGSHEGSGTVVAVGSDVKNFKEGDRVMCGIPLHPCGECGDCTGPETFRQYCTKAEGMIGVTLDGCFAEYCKVDSSTLTPLPDNVTFASAAPLACAGRTVWRAVLQTGLKKGEWVAIVGSGGGLGHLGIQYAKALGLKVVGIDARDEGLELSKHYGADVVVDARKGKEENVKEVQKVTDGKGADASITLADHDTAAALSCAVTKMHGIMVQVAQPDQVKIPFAELIFRDIKIHGSLICSPNESEGMMKCIAEHGVTATTQKFEGLESIKKLTELVHSGNLKGKAILVIDPEQLEQEKKLGAKY